MTLSPTHLPGWGRIAAALGLALSGAAMATASPQAPVAVQALQQVLHPTDSAVTVPARQTLQDATYVHNGSRLYLEDMQQRIRQLTAVAASAPSVDSALPALNAMRLLESGKRHWPQAVKFEVRQRNDGLTLQPLDWSERVAVKSDRRADVTVVGGELESVATAMRFAHKGWKVALIYGGPLADLNSDEGANMRYFDCVRSVARTPEQLEMFKDAFHSADCNVVPDHASELLHEFLAERYPAIQLIPTATLNSMHVQSGAGRIQSVTTGEGVRVSSRVFVGTDPEGILAEKVGLAAETEHVVNMADGVVFDVENLRAADLQRLSGALTLDTVARLAGSTAAQVQAQLHNHATLRQAYTAFQSASQGAPGRSGPDSFYGDSRLGTGYALYCRILELSHPHLKAVNDARDVGGFNVAEHREGGGRETASFNSISYQFEKSFHQGDHDLHTDPDLALVRQDMSLLNGFLRQVAGDPNIRVHMPREMYIRKAARMFQTTQERGLDNILTPQTGAIYRFRYYNDGRGNNSSNATSARFDAIDNVLREPIEAAVTAAQTQTSYRNFYVLGKSVGFKAEAIGWGRIQQQSMDVGATLAEDLADGRPIPPLRGSIYDLPPRLRPLVQAADAERDYQPPTAGLGSHQRQLLEHLDR